MPSWSHEECSAFLRQRVSRLLPMRAAPTGVVGVAFAAMLAVGQPVHAADDGARAYRLAPADTHAAALFGIFQRGNASVDSGTVVADADLDLNLALPMYLQGISIGGQSGVIGVAIPYGEVKGEVRTGPTTTAVKDTGFADANVFGMVGLYNMPALGLDDYVKKKAGMSVALLGKASVPIGSYDSARPINVGANRWAFTVALPVTISLTNTYVDPEYASIEIMPSATFYTKNEDAVGAALTQSQKPLFMLEAHVTRNISPKTFVSLDALAISGGGETSNDGISNNDFKSGIGIGATIATMLTATMELRATYGASVAKNGTGFDTDMLRVGLTKVF